jgi:hypothetical protein
MERIRSGERSHAAEAVRDDAAGRVVVGAGMLVFLVGLAMLFVLNAPS